MLLDLNRLHGSREHVERTFQPADFDPQDDEYRVAGPVELVMDVARSGPETFAAAGTVKARLQIDCGRCLDPFEVPVDAVFDLRYVPAAQNAGEGEREVGPEDLTIAFHREGMLDLVDLIREQLVLALPMKPLCGPDCRGLCAVCGTNLNQTTCDCAPTWEDPRLAPLKSLLPRDEEN